MHIPRRSTAALLAAAALLAGMAPGALAQDPSSSPAVPQTCGVLTADEVSSALGETVTIASGGDVDCEFDTDSSSGRFLSLFTSMDTGTAARLRDIMCPADATPDPSSGPCAIDLTVAGQPAVYLGDALGGTLLYAEMGTGGLLNIQLVGDVADGIDAQAAMTGLAELAVPRAAAMPQASLPSDAPVPSFTPDTALEALFPTDIAGQPLTVQSLSGGDVSAGVPQGFLDALSGIGKTISDVSVAIAYGGSDPSSGLAITALKVAGADMVALKPQVLPALFEGQDVTEGGTQQLSGKDVTTAVVDGTTSYLYPHDDVLWIVTADEPALTEVFRKLP